MYCIRKKHQDNYKENKLIETCLNNQEESVEDVESENEKNDEDEDSELDSELSNSIISETPAGAIYVLYFPRNHIPNHQPIHCIYFHWYSLLHQKLPFLSQNFLMEFQLIYFLKY